MHLEGLVEYGELKDAVLMNINRDFRANLFFLVANLCPVDESLSAYIRENASVVEKELPSEVQEYYRKEASEQSYRVLNLLGFAVENFITPDSSYVDLSEISRFLDNYEPLSGIGVDVGQIDKFYDEILLLKRLKFMVDPMIDGAKSAKKTYQSYKYLGMLESIKEKVDAFDESLKESYNAMLSGSDE